MNTREKIATCLWYDGAAEQAAQLYTSLIADSCITSVYRPEPHGPALLVEFTLAGVPYQALNGGAHFRHCEAASIVVKTDSQAETDKLWQALIADGGSPSQCGWLKDRFGLSWQIVPWRFIDLLQSPDRAAAQRATEAMLQMGKLDMAALEAAFKGDAEHA
ncbi:VOC family protein [Pseudomonas borbori]